jgi:exodeoxyribonuclease-5
MPRVDDEPVIASSPGRVELTREQQDALCQLLTLKKRTQTLGGYAGTGKTTVIKHLADALPDFAVCAYTGKAAHVLRCKGVSAQTIHSLIYHPVEVDEDNVQFVRTEVLNCGGVIVDEASMVSEQLHQDLTSFGVPLIFVGDHGQLPPVQPAGSPAFNLMAKPDLTLEKIHRNAGEIARFAEFLRRGGEARDWTKQPGCTGKNVQLVILEEAAATLEKALTYDQLIVAFNKTRVAINDVFRSHLGRTTDGPAVGDRVMCLQNNRFLGLFNGMQGKVGRVYGQNRMDFAVDGRMVPVRYMPDAFNAVSKPPRDKHGRMPFDYSWAATCHKCQGSEWDRVLVIEERCQGWEHARWAYTAASRARVQLDWVPG